MLWWFAQTTLIAGALAVVAIVMGRWKRLGPEARHALWLLVLIKLAIPPFVAWPWSLPDAWPARVEPAAVVVALADPPIEVVAISPPDAWPALPPDPTIPGPPPTPEEVLAGVEVEKEAPAPGVPDLGAIESRPDPPASVPTPRTREPEISNARSSIWNWDTPLLALWLAGSAVVVARRGFKVVRFHRSLADSRPAPDWLIEQARAIGGRVGVRPPPVVATSRVATPLLWCLGRPRLILPEALIKRLGVDRWPGILAHELAHLARGDHWVVRLELLVEAVWWWNPLFWIARRRLHEEAEIACDARVVRSLPDRRYAYAEALVDVCEHIARSAIPSPALGVGGAGAAHSLEGRLHMILQDSIPGRPTRRAALLAVLLAALALPAWTLGQQPEIPPAKPDTPPSKPEEPPSRPLPKADAPPSKPDAPPEAPPAPQAGSPPPQASAPASPSVTIEAILTAQAKAREGLGNLAFRYVVAGRDQSRSFVFPPGWGGGMNASGQPALPRQRVKTVRVQVADVILDFNGHSRLDVIEARPPTDELHLPGGPTRPPAWDRRFVAKGDSGYMALEASGDKDGPVPFRWLGANNRQGASGDPLTSAFFQNSLPRIDQDKGIDPLDPRPANMLDLNGVSPLYLDANTAHAEVVGLDTIDGLEVVRVAWIANANIGLRGLCWLAPDLGYAVVRSDATMDPRNTLPIQGRWSCRRRSSDFAKVANLWLPRKVTHEESQADPSGGDPVYRLEREMIFEDYRLTAKVTADTFRPKLAIQAIDDLSGNFTAKPPELPSGLAERLTRAVRESKFGPPVVEKTIEEPKAVATPPVASRKLSDQPNGVTLPAPVSRKPGDQPNPGPGASQPPQGAKPGDSPPDLNAANRRYRDIVANVDEAPTGRLMFKEGQANRLPGPSFGNDKGPTRLDSRFAPVDDAAKADPKIIAPPLPGFADPIPVLDPKVGDPISAKAPADRAGLDRAIARRFMLDPEVITLADQLKQARDKLNEAQRLALPSDPAVRATQRKLDTLKTKYEQLWEAKSPGLVEELGLKQVRAGDEVEVLQARRDGKAAEVRKAEALSGLAGAVVQRNETLKKKGSNYVSNEELAKAEGERAVAEAEIASKKAELAEADAYLNQAKRRLGGQLATPSGPVASSSGERPATLTELRDAIELTEVQLQGKQAELRKVQAMADLARREATHTQRLADKQGVSKMEVELFNDKADAAQGELEAKKAEVLEFEIRIKQAKRRLEAGEARLKREAERIKARLDWSEGLFKKGYVSKATYEADKAAYDELMIQLDPKYVPTPAAEVPKVDAP